MVTAAVFHFAFKQFAESLQKKDFCDFTEPRKTSCNLVKSQASTSLGKWINNVINSIIMIANY